MHPITVLNSIPPPALILSEVSSLTITLLTKQYLAGVCVVLKLLFIHLFITALFQIVIRELQALWDSIRAHKHARNLNVNKHTSFNSYTINSTARVWTQHLSGFSFPVLRRHYETPAKILLYSPESQQSQSTTWRERCIRSLALLEHLVVSAALAKSLPTTLISYAKWTGFSVALVSIHSSSSICISISVPYTSPLPSLPKKLAQFSLLKKRATQSRGQR